MSVFSLLASAANHTGQRSGQGRISPIPPKTSRDDETKRDDETSRELPVVCAFSPSRRDRSGLRLGAQLESVDQIEGADDRRSVRDLAFRRRGLAARVEVVQERSTRRSW